MVHLFQPLVLILAPKTREAKNFNKNYRRTLVQVRHYLLNYYCKCVYGVIKWPYSLLIAYSAQETICDFVNVMLSW